MLNYYVLWIRGISTISDWVLESKVLDRKKSVSRLQTILCVLVTTTGDLRPKHL